MSTTDFTTAMKFLEAQDYRRARDLLEQIPHDNEARLQLAYLLQEGLGGDRDSRAAKAIYESLSDAGHVIGTYYLGSLLLKEGDVGNALRSFEFAAQRGHCSAAYWAAALYSGMSGSRPDPLKYAYYTDLAANGGHYFAQRDKWRLEMKTSKSFAHWVTSLLKLIGAKFKGSLTVARNPDDIRVR